MEKENVLIGNEHIVFAEKYKTPEQHRHFAKHLLFAVNGEVDDSRTGA